MKTSRYFVILLSIVLVFSLCVSDCVYCATLLNDPGGYPGLSATPLAINSDFGPRCIPNMYPKYPVDAYPKGTTEIYTNPHVGIDYHLVPGSSNQFEFGKCVESTTITDISGSPGYRTIWTNGSFKYVHLISSDTVQRSDGYKVEVVRNYSGIPDYTLLVFYRNGVIEKVLGRTDQMVPGTKNPISLFRNVAIRSSISAGEDIFGKGKPFAFELFSKGYSDSSKRADS